MGIKAKGDNKWRFGRKRSVSSVRQGGKANTIFLIKLFD